MSNPFQAYVVPTSAAERRMKLADDKKRQLEARVSIATTPQEEELATFTLRKFLADEYETAKVSLAESQVREAAQADARAKAAEIMSQLDEAKKQDPFTTWTQEQRDSAPVEQQKADWLERAKRGETLT